MPLDARHRARGSQDGTDLSPLAVTAVVRLAQNAPMRAGGSGQGGKETVRAVTAAAVSPTHGAAGHGARLVETVKAAAARVDADRAVRAAPGPGGGQQFRDGERREQRQYSCQANSSGGHFSAVSGVRGRTLSSQYTGTASARHPLNKPPARRAQ